MAIDTNELRRLAQAATPGGWYVARGNYVYGCKDVTDGEEVWHPVIACTDDDEVSINFEGNAKFIAAANPAVINELLDRLEESESDCLEQARLNGMGASREATLMAKLEAAEKERDHEKWLRERAEDYAKAVEEQRDALRAKITGMEQQEPVAFGLYSGWALKATYLKEHEACEQRDRRQLTADLSGSLEAYRVVPLYAIPGAQPAPSASEDWLQHAARMAVLARKLREPDWHFESIREMQRELRMLEEAALDAAQGAST